MHLLQQRRVELQGVKTRGLAERLSLGAFALPSYHADTDPPQRTFMRRQIDLLAATEPLGFDSVWITSTTSTLGAA